MKKNNKMYDIYDLENMIDSSLKKYGINSPYIDIAAKVRDYTWKYAYEYYFKIVGNNEDLEIIPPDLKGGD